MRKLSGVKGYRLTLAFAIASVFFAITYVLTVDRTVVAALFVALFAAVMLVDSRVQRARSGGSNAAEDPPEPDVPAEQQTRAAAAVVDAPAIESETPAPQETPGPPPSLLGAGGLGPAPLAEDDAGLVGGYVADHTGAPEQDTPEQAGSTPKSAAMARADWLRVLREEYLQDFVKNAGAAIKFVIPQEPEQRQALWDEVQKASQDNDFLSISVDAAATRVHMVDEVFYEIARQVDWDDLALGFLRKTLEDGHYLFPQDEDEFNLSRIAAMNGLDLGEMRAIINNRLRDNLSRYFEMAEDFRMAMLKLCQAQLDPQDLGVGAAEAVREWLRGDLKLISALKSASIFEKISRSNGRDMISSLAHWLHLAGKSGLVLGLDISRFLVAKRHGQPDSSIYYNTASVLDGYEVLRQFIDSTDELQYCLIVVSAPPTFLTDDQRGVRKYNALFLRIWDEVHDRQTVNPLSTLIRITGQESPVLQRA